MDRILVLYYSQSGEVADIARLFTTELSRTGVEVTIERLDPETAYPTLGDRSADSSMPCPRACWACLRQSDSQGTIRRAASGWWF